MVPGPGGTPLHGERDQLSASQLREEAEMHDRLAELYDHMGKVGSALAEREQATRDRVAAALLEAP